MNLLFPILFSIATFTTADSVQSVQDDVLLNVSLEPTSFTVGDSLLLQVEAIAPDGVQLTLPFEDGFGSFVVTDSTTLLDVPTNSGRRWAWSFQLDTFDAQTTVLDGIELSWIDRAGNSGQIVSEPIDVTITSVAGNALQEMELRDIKGSIPLLSSLGLWTIISLIVIAIATIVAWFLFRKPKQERSPQEKAMLALQELQSDNLDAKSFYTVLSRIVRTYIEEQFQIKATEKTTREFLIAEKENPRLEHRDRKALADFLVMADLIKFAKFEATSNSKDEAISYAEQFISCTKPTHDSQRVEAAA